MSHIVIGLSVIVFYRLASRLKINNFFNNNKENFDDMNDFINGNNDFIEPVQVSSLSQTQISDYSNKLDTIINNLQDLQKKQSAGADPLANVNPANLNTLDLSAQQQYQIFQIDYLNKQIKNAQDVINAETLAESNTVYKPIKVFSSCIVANADGSVTKDTPISNQFQNIANNSSSANNMLKTISQSNNQSNGPDLLKPSLLLSPNAGVFNNILSSIQKSGVVNIQ